MKAGLARTYGPNSSLTVCAREREIEQRHLTHGKLGAHGLEREIPTHVVGPLP